jgi:hypothetical protein
LTLKTTAFRRDGFVSFAQDPALLSWVQAVQPHAEEAARDPVQIAKWLRSGGTWFVGVDVLGNRSDGTVGASGPLSGRAADFCRGLLGDARPDWGLGQVSICYPGYPKQDEGERDAFFKYRQHRDAAHLDGLKPIGPKRQRMLQEFHGLILGIPLVDVPPDALPFVIWCGSHVIVQKLLTEALTGIDPAQWSGVDLTDAYHEARRQIWEECERVELSAKPGEAYVAHRFSLHGVAPWRARGAAPVEGRMIAYFRPFVKPGRSFLVD